MRLSVNDLRTLILNLPDAASHVPNGFHQNAVCLNNDGTIHPTNVRRIEFLKNSDHTDWDIVSITDHPPTRVV